MKLSEVKHNAVELQPGKWYVVTVDGHAIAMFRDPARADRYRDDECRNMPAGIVEVLLP